MVPPQMLSALLDGLAEVAEALDRPVKGLALDSRKVRRDDLFLAVAGTRTHGIRHAPAAVAAGAGAVAHEPVDETPPVLSVPLIPVPGLGQRVGVIADRFYGEPTRDLAVVAVTGTNGKTSVTHYVAQALGALGRGCGIVGTLGSGMYGRLGSAAQTTPDPVALHELLRDLRRAGATHVAMEASSHGLHQGRLAGVRVHTAVLTNLSRDHLDYHGSMEAYAEAKALLFRHPGLRARVLNTDDAFGRRLLGAHGHGERLYTYGFGEWPADLPGDALALRGHGLVLDANGLTLQVTTPWGEVTLRARLLGRFNAHNLLAAFATLLALDIGIEAAAAALTQVRPVPGRMECFGGGAQPLVVVDYAHTPDALEQALDALRGHATGRLHCVFGCGGDRDPGKRPLMGAVAERLADRVVLTDDNPRGEDGGAIIEAICAGMAMPEGVVVERDRARAIAAALAAARAGDVVLIAGKGHEDYQEVAGTRRPYSDRAVALELAGEFAGGHAG